MEKLKSTFHIPAILDSVLFIIISGIPAAISGLWVKVRCHFRLGQVHAIRHRQPITNGSFLVQILMLTLLSKKWDRTEQKKATQKNLSSLQIRIVDTH